MPTDTTTLKLSIDSRDVKRGEKDLDSLTHAAGRSEQIANKLSTAFKVGIATSAAAASVAMYKLANAGFEFNKSMENSINGLTALTVATSSNISSTGKMLTIQEKYTLAQKEATDTAKALAKINAETPHTLDQTNKIYKAMYVSMKAANVTNEEMLDLTKKISIASGAAGIEFSSLLSSVDGLASGTVLANGDLGRFLVSLGLTNEKLKESKNVYKTVNDALKDFRAVDDFATAISNLENEYSKLAGTATSDIFSATKEGAKELSKAIAALSDEDIAALTKGMNALGAAGATVVYGMAVGVIELSNAFETLGARIAGAAFRVESGFLLNDDESKALEAMYQSTKDNIAAREKVLVALENAKNKFTENLNKAPEVKAKEVANEAAEKLIRDTTAKQLEALGIKQKAEAEAFEDLKKLKQNYADEIKSINDEIYLNSSDGIEREKAQTFNYYDSLIAKYGEVAGAEKTLRAMQTAAIDSLIEKQNKNLVAEAMGSMITPLDTAIDKFHELEKAMLTTYASGSEVMKKFYEMQRNKINEIEKSQDKTDKKTDKSIKNQINSFEELYRTSTSLMNEFYDDDDSRKKKQIEVDKAIRIITNTAMLADLALALTTESTKQSSLATTALVAQLQLPFPANIPAYAAVAGMIASLGIALGGSSGAGGGISSPNETGQEMQLANISAEYTPITDRLDSQISLLSSIDKNGSAGQKETILALNDFEKSLKENAVNVSATANRGVFDSSIYGFNTFSGAQDFDLLRNELKNKYDLTGLYSSIANGDRDLYYSFQGIFDTQEELLIYIANRADIERMVQDYINMPIGSAMSEDNYQAMIASVQVIINDFATAMANSVSDLQSSSLEFQDIFDSLTNSTTYESVRFQRALTDVNALRGNDTLTNYVQTQIESINRVVEIYDAATIQLLMDTDPTKIGEQSQRVIDLNIDLQGVYSGTAKEAINYIESIQLVSETMANSRDNIKSYEDSFKTQSQLVEDMWNNVTQQSTAGIATTMEELSSLFVSLSTSGGILTDSELQLLTANKALIQTRLDEEKALAESNASNYINELTSNLSKLQPITNTLSNTIDKLRGSSVTSEESLSSFYSALNEPTTLSTSGSYEDFSMAVQKATSLSNILENNNNFLSNNEMEFAKLSAAIQFENLETLTLKEVDYLKMIVENTDPLKQVSASYGFGGATTVPTVAQAVVAPSFSGSFIQNDNVNVVSALTSQNTLLNAIIARQDTQISILSESRDFHNLNLQKLTLIEEGN